MDIKIKDFVRKYYMYIGVGLFAVVSLILTIDIEKEENVPDFSPVYETENQFETYIYIDIQGSVLNPGVYKVTTGTRLFQLISLAGGFTMDANEQIINQSQLLIDEMFIYVPNIYEEDDIDGETGDNSSLETLSKIDINSSTKTELETLPGIGPATAQSIIDYRTDIEAFSKVEDIMNVPGIGEATYNEIKDLITT